MLLVKRAARLSWITVALLAASCCVLAVFQYRWISEFTEAERHRLATDLESRLNLVARGFNQQISRAFSALIPIPSRVDAVGPEKAYAAAYENSRASRVPAFRRIALVTPGENGLAFLNLDLETGRFSPSAWPAAWAGLRERLEARGDPRRAPPPDSDSPPLLQAHSFSESGENWLIAELDVDYVREKMLPPLLNRFLRISGKLDYDWDLATDNTSVTPTADASVDLLDTDFGPHDPPHGPGRGRGPGPPPLGAGPRFDMENAVGGPFDPLPDFEHTRWRLLVRHHGGSLEAFVAQAKWRNIAASAGLLLLILATVAALVRVTRQSQRLAAAQMDFVAGVSHELRTPLTVIRTAAYNLKRNVAHRPEQVEQYGELIQEQSEKLTELVEQVLRFARSEAGHVIGAREPVQVEDLIEASLQFSGEPLELKGIAIEKRIAGDLPPILADRLAMKHALQNLIENAIKYGTAWVGISVRGDAGSVEIRIADRGPGIPDDEQRRIFDPFFRGRRALSNQVHGTGLGLSLAKKIIEAHGGAIRVESEPARGSEFIVRVPAAPEELNHELAHSLG